MRCSCSSDTTGVIQKLCPHMSVPHALCLRLVLDGLQQLDRGEGGDPAVGGDQAAEGVA